MAVKPIPDGYHTVTPYVMVHGVGVLLEFLKNAFGATTGFQMAGPDGKIGHAEVKIGDSMVMLAEARDHWTPMPCGIYLFVEDTDATYESAIKAGGESLMAPADQFYGDRNAGVKDPSGNMWWIATRIEDVPHDELIRRGQAQGKA